MWKLWSGLGKQRRGDSDELEGFIQARHDNLAGAGISISSPQTRNRYINLTILFSIPFSFSLLLRKKADVGGDDGARIAKEQPRLMI